MLIKSYSSKAFNFIPSIVILFFSMVSLYSVTQVVGIQNDLRTYYKESSQSFIEIEESWHEFEKAYDVFLLNADGRNISEVKNNFKNLSYSLNSFHAMRDNFLSKDPDHVVEYERIYYSLISRMSKFALKIKEGTSNKFGDSGDVPGDIAYLIMELKNIAFDDFVENALQGEIKKYEIWMYWSISIAGFCGLFLIVLNFSKSKAMDYMYIEKHEALGLLKNRVAALEVARDGIFIMDKNDKISYMNKSFCSIIGTDESQRDALTGKTWVDIFLRSDCEIIEEDILPELYENGFWVGDFQIFRDDNSFVHTEMSFTRLPDGGLIGTVQDVSYKKKAEQEKKDLEDQFYQAQKMEAIGRLAGGIAHDFNNILAAMNGYAEFLVDDLDKSSEQRKFAENILQAGMQARELVDQMLAFSRRSDSTKNTLDIVASVKEALSMVNVTIPKTIEMNSDIYVDHAVINGNQTQISQLIMNLCVNAQDAIEDDHGSLSIALNLVEPSSVDIDDVVREDLPDPKELPYLRMDDLEAGRSRLILGHISEHNQYIKLSITDTGTGMSRVIMEHIFEPFFTTKPVDKGTGLGLATVHGVLVSHQGFMVIDSALGKGTKFDLYFPLVKDAVVRKPSAKDSSKSDENKSKSGHILLVEDQENVRDMVLKMLERMGYNVSSVESGLEGLDIIRENPDGFDLIITDHNMPKMTGLEMINQIYEDLPDLPFILLSGYSEDKMQEIIDGHPAIRAVLRKPVTKKVLSGKIDDVFRQSVAA